MELIMSHVTTGTREHSLLQHVFEDRIHESENIVRVQITGIRIIIKTQLFSSYFLIMDYWSS